jgi:hypothetical protein
MRRLLLPVVLLVPFAVGADFPRGKEVAHRPDGHWTIGEARGGRPDVEMKAANGRVTWKVSLPASVVRVVHLEADFSVTKDSICYGIVTKTDYRQVDAKTKEKLPEVDDTFSFRFRADDDELNVRDLKGKGFDQLKMIAGRYKKRLESPRDKDKRKDKDK